MQKSTWQIGLVIGICALAITVYFVRGRAVPKYVSQPSSASPPSVNATLQLEVQPAKDTVELTLSQLEEVVNASSNSALPQSLKNQARQDLGRASRAWIAAMIDPDFSAFHKFRVERGYVHPEESAEEKRIFEQCVKDTSLANLSIAGANVRMIYVDGRRVAPPDREGYVNALETAIQGAYPVPEDIKGARATIVEVRLPMERRSPEGRPVPVVVGYRFFWHPKRMQWIPHSTVQCYDTSDAITITPI